MSLLTFVVKFSNSEIWKAKIDKSVDLNNFQNIIFFNNEQKLKDYINEFYPVEQNADLTKHEEYDDPSALFAPYDYGMVFVDFTEKKMYSFNDYSGFMCYPLSQIKYEIENNFFRHVPINKKNFMAEQTFLRKEFIINPNTDDYILYDNYDVRKNHTPKYHWLFNIYSGLQQNAKFEYIVAGDNKKFNILEKTDFEVISSAIEILNEIRGVEIDAFYMDVLNIYPDGWDFIQGSRSSIDIEFYNTLKQTISFTLLFNKHRENKK